MKCFVSNTIQWNMIILRVNKKLKRSRFLFWRKVLNEWRAEREERPCTMRGRNTWDRDVLAIPTFSTLQEMRKTQGIQFRLVKKIITKQRFCATLAFFNEWGRTNIFEMKKCFNSKYFSLMENMSFHVSKSPTNIAMKLACHFKHSNSLFFWCCLNWRWTSLRTNWMKPNTVLNHVYLYVCLNWRKFN